MSEKRSQFNEATRVQMPAIVHLTRLGYEYYGKISEESARVVYDADTNILLDVFRAQFQKAGFREAHAKTFYSGSSNYSDFHIA